MLWQPTVFAKNMLAKFSITMLGPTKFNLMVTKKKSMMEATETGSEKNKNIKPWVRCSMSALLWETNARIEMLSKDQIKILEATKICKEGENGRT